MMKIVVFLIFCVQLSQAASDCPNPCNTNDLLTCKLQQCKTLINTNDDAWGCHRNGRISVISNKTGGVLKLDHISCNCETGKWHGFIKFQSFYLEKDTVVQCVPNPYFEGEVDFEWYTVDIVLTTISGVIIFIAITMCMGCMFHFRGGFQSL